MARPERREEHAVALPAAVRIIDDDPAAGGRVICVAGNAPGIARIVGFDGMVSYAFEAIPYDAFDGRTTLWPVAAPDDFRRYASVRFYLARDLRPVDVLHVLCGRWPDASAGFYLWQAAADPPLVALTEREARLALRSSWVASVRADGGLSGVRGIIVRQ